MKYVQTLMALSIFLMWSAGCITNSAGISSSGTSRSMWQEAEWVSNGDYPKYDDSGLQIRAHIAHPSFIYATNDGIDSIASEIMSMELIARTSREYLNAIERTGTSDVMGGHQEIYGDYIGQTVSALIFRQRTYWEIGEGSRAGRLETQRYNVWGIYRTTSEEYRRIKLAAWDKLVLDLETKGLAAKISTQKIRSQLEADPAHDL